MKRLDKRLLLVTSVFIIVFLFLTVMSGIQSLFLLFLFFVVVFVAQIVEAKYGNNWLIKIIFPAMIILATCSSTIESVKDLIYTAIIATVIYLTIFLIERYLKQNS